MRDERIHAALERLPDPAEGERFFEELWARADVADRAARRNARVLLVAAVAAVVVGAAAAGVLAFRKTQPTLADRTVRCTAATQEGIDSFEIQLVVQPRVSELEIYSGDAWILSLNRLGTARGVWADSTACGSATRVPLAAGRLRHATRFGAEGGEFEDKLFCSTTRALFHVHVTYDAAGNPTSWKLAVRRARDAKTIAFVDMRPPHVTEYTSAVCGHS